MSFREKNNRAFQEDEKTVISQRDKKTTTVSRSSRQTQQDVQQGRAPQSRQGRQVQEVSQATQATQGRQGRQVQEVSQATQATRGRQVRQVQEVLQATQATQATRGRQGRQVQEVLQATQATQATRGRQGRQVQEVSQATQVSQVSQATQGRQVQGLLQQSLCLYDSTSSYALRENATDVEVMTNVKDIKGCIQLKSYDVTNNDYQIINPNKVPQDAIRDIVFRYNTIKNKHSIKDEIARNWKSEVHTLSESLKKHSILAKFNFYKRIHSRLLELGIDTGDMVTLGSVDEDRKRAKSRISGKIAAMFDKIGFNNSYAVFSRKTQQVKAILDAHIAESSRNNESFNHVENTVPTFHDATATKSFFFLVKSFLEGLTDGKKEVSRVIHTTMQTMQTKGGRLNELDTSRFLKLLSTLLENTSFFEAVQQHTDVIPKLIHRKVEADDLFALIMLAMLQQPSLCDKTNVKVIALRALLDYWHRHSVTTPFYGQVAFWKEMVKTSTEPLNLFNQSSKLFLDAINENGFDKSVFTQFMSLCKTSSANCIQFILAAYRDIKLDCVTEDDDIAISETRDVKNRSVCLQLLREIQRVKIKVQVPHIPQSMDALMNKIVCQKWRDNVTVDGSLNPLGDSKPGFVAALMSGELFGDSIPKHYVELERKDLENSPFIESPFMFILAESMRLRVNTVFLTRGCDLISRFLERDAILTLDCEQDLNNEIHRVTFDISVLHATFNENKQKGGGSLASEDDMGARRAVMVIFFYERVQEIAERYYSMHAQFYQRHLQPFVEYAMRFPPNLPYLDHEEVLSLDAFSKSLTELSNRGESFFVTFLGSIQESQKQDEIYDLADVGEDADVLIDRKKVTCMLRISELGENIVSLYKNEMRLIFDTQFLILAGLKLAQLGITAFSLNMATKLFEDKYLIQVYTQNKEPPSIYIMFAYFLGFNLAINAVLFFVIWILSYVRNLPSAPSLFDYHLLLRALLDYVTSLVILMLLSFIVASIIVKKRYFRYDLEGPRAIRALQEIMFYIAVLLTGVPFFIVV